MRKLVFMYGVLLYLSPSAFADIAGCEVFPSNNFWNTPINTLDVHPQSDEFIASIGGDTPVHPDFGTVWEGVDIGLTYDVVPADQPSVPISFLWGGESDLGDTACNVDQKENTGCYPIPQNPSIEGGIDHHALLIQEGTCLLYEIFGLEKENGLWSAGSGAIWDMNLNEVRAKGKTSADAAGLAIFPGLLRYDEVYTDAEVNHALRVTIGAVQRGYIRPASHSDGSAGNDPKAPPMGLRLRLKEGFDISGFPPDIQIILRGLKKYGLVVADTGGSMFITGVHDDRWDDEVLGTLKTVIASDFEAVYTGEVIPYDGNVDDDSAEILPGPGDEDQEHSCHKITDDDSMVNTQLFGVPFNLFDAAKKVLIRVFCKGEAARMEVGREQSGIYIYSSAYVWGGNDWKHISLTGADTVGDWIIGKAEAQLPDSLSQNETEYVVAYMCQREDDTWKCGCRDKICAENLWNLQSYSAIPPTPEV